MLLANNEAFSDCGQGRLVLTHGRGKTNLILRGIKMKKIMTLVFAILVSVSVFAQDSSLAEEGREIVKELGSIEGDLAQANQWTADYIQRLLLENARLKEDNARLSEDNEMLDDENVDLLTKNWKLTLNNVNLIGKNGTLKSDNDDLRDMNHVQEEHIETLLAEVEEGDIVIGDLNNRVVPFLRDRMGELGIGLEEKDDVIEQMDALIHSLKAYLSLYMTNDAMYEAWYIHRDETKEELTQIINEAIANSWMLGGTAQERENLRILNLRIMGALGENVLAPAPPLN